MSAYHIRRQILQRQLGESSHSTMWMVFRNFYGLYLCLILSKFLYGMHFMKPCLPDLILPGEKPWNLHCPICGIEEETVYHILWSCPSASDIWFICSLKIHKTGLTDVDFSGVVFQLFSQLSKADFIFFRIICQTVMV